MFSRFAPISIVILVAALTACGTVATPEWAAEAQATRAAMAITSEYETSIAPTATPSNTPVLSPTPTATFTHSPVPPTATPTIEPPTATIMPPTATPDYITLPSGEVGFPAEGATIFTTMYSQVNFACATCHYPNQEAQLIGPGLLNISLRAESRVAGQTAEEYIRNSILHPGAYVVESFPDGLMPQVYGDFLTPEEINDLIAYLFTLR